VTRAHVPRQRAFPNAIKFVYQPFRAKLRNRAGQMDLLKQVREPA
jgi:hypothetical protein